MRTRRLLAVLALVALAPAVRAADPPSAPVSGTLGLEAGLEVAPVVVDGRTLFRVAGLESTFPAQARAERIATRIEALGAEPSFDPRKIRVEAKGDERIVKYDQALLLAIAEADSRAVGLAEDELARAYSSGIAAAVAPYRADRLGDVKREARR